METKQGYPGVRLLAWMGILLWGSVIFFGCATTPTGPAIYTAHNIWYENPERIYCLNYKVGARLPAGSEIKSVKVEKNYIRFRPMADDREFIIHFQPRYHPGKSIYDYKNMMFTAKPFEELVQGMSEEEIVAIQNGMVTAGMSKEAVLASYGPPPEHRTPSLLSTVWIYWITRHGNRQVVFGEDNRTLR